MRHDTRSVGVLELIAPHLQLAFSRALHGEDAAARRVALSSREQEVIEWLQQGKSSWEISVILGVSERTVNFHVSNITGTWERHAGGARAPLRGYCRREPEKTLLHRAVRERLETFLAAARERSAHGRGLPAFVERELRA